ncbi:TetR/AcrR family transcriptional regulator [Paenibacillus maysiensis]|uniref:TetR/AcrR family transcriptional regulator n=1 Tax=Paenibacillus maysiensis TaxID=1155954 RepID=UPI00046E8422|nr:helix-turn-helix domain-containing protein [Paenibacillus maysiensis]
MSQGYSITTIRQIAEAAQIGRGHLYYYFKKKEDILLHLYMGLIGNIHELLNNVLSKELDPWRNTHLRSMPLSICH